MSDLRASAATGVAVQFDPGEAASSGRRLPAGEVRNAAATPAERIIREPHLVQDGVIRLCDGIGRGCLVTEDRVRASLHVLADFPTISLFIDCPGGDAGEAHAIYSMLRECGKPVRGRIKRALSGGAVIAMAADDIEIEPDAVMMIHGVALDLQHVEMARGTASFFRDLADGLERKTERSLDIFARRTGHDREMIRRMLATDTYFEPAEAVRLGFADRVREKYLG